MDRPGLVDIKGRGRYNKWMNYQECKTPSCGNPVFSLGLCRKHYEQDRLAKADPCSFSGCTARCFRGDLCETHYRAKIKASHPPCIIPNCGEPQKNLSSGLCNKHDFRMRKHGAVDQPRATDWGSREAHPLYQTYCAARRNKEAGMVQEWRDSFWRFVECVSDRPVAHSLRRKDTTKPIGPDNWYWKVPIAADDPAKYQRVWRKNNPERAKSHNLRKSYGIDLKEYERLVAAQQGMCAICSSPETTKDKDGGPRMMPVDHDHKTGKVRALLCTQCNRGLGMFTDSIEKLRAAVDYLEKHLAPPEIK